MKVLITIALLAIFSLSTGCNHRKEDRVTNPSAPGPAVGVAVGSAVGAVGSNVVGLGVGMVEGASHATRRTFDSERRIVRQWRTETTPDGRVIRVPVEVAVDEYGRVIE